MNEYTQQAENFAAKYGVTLEILGREYKSMWGEKQNRSVFKLCLKRGRKQYTFEFGQSIQAKNRKPTIYDVLACLQKYDVGSFDDFCSEFGCEQTERTYKALCKEYASVERLFGDCIEELQEIA